MEPLDVLTRNMSLCVYISGRSISIAVSEQVSETCVHVHIAGTVGKYGIRECWEIGSAPESYLC